MAGVRTSHQREGEGAGALAPYLQGGVACGVPTVVAACSDAAPALCCFHYVVVRLYYSPLVLVHWIEGGRWRCLKQHLFLR